MLLSTNNTLLILGYDRVSQCLSSVERNVPTTNEWELLSLLGYDGASRQCLSSVERYDPTTNEWELIADMTVKRSGAGVGVVGKLNYFSC